MIESCKETSNNNLERLKNLFEKLSEISSECVELIESLIKEQGEDITFIENLCINSPYQVGEYYSVKKITKMGEIYAYGGNIIILEELDLESQISIAKAIVKQYYTKSKINNILNNEQ